MGEFKEVKSSWFKATKIGDNIEGTLVVKEMREGTDPQGRPQTQEIYEILADSGEFHALVEKDGQKVIDEENPIKIEQGEYYQFAKGSVVNTMNKIEIGQKVKLIYDSSIPSKDKMKNAFKLVKVYAGEVDEEWMKSKWGEVPVEDAPKDDIKVDEIPFE